MPQLDLLTFFTQFFWAVLCLFIFYFFVSKLILPELTRVLKYRSKASTFSTSGERLDLASQRGEQGGSDSLSHSSGKSGSSALYQYACASSTRVLVQARQRRDTFLSKVTSGKVLKDDQKQDLASLHPDSVKTSSKNSKTSKNTRNSKNSKSTKTT